MLSFGTIERWFIPATLKITFTMIPVDPLESLDFSGQQRISL